MRYAALGKRLGQVLWHPLSTLRCRLHWPARQTRGVHPVLIVDKVRHEDPVRRQVAFKQREELLRHQMFGRCNACDAAICPSAWRRICTAADMKRGEVSVPHAHLWQT